MIQTVRVHGTFSETEFDQSVYIEFSQGMVRAERKNFKKEGHQNFPKFTKFGKIMTSGAKKLSFRNNIFFF